MPVYAEQSILGLERIYINGGRRGFLVGMDPKLLPSILPLTPVSCALPGQ
jgi:prolyl-tRNA editing enzyme YbaK/EbsC (Cys-tRNA(Pro) deacylase)